VSACNARSRVRWVRGSAERGVGGGRGGVRREDAIENAWCVCASRPYNAYFLVIQSISEKYNHAAARLSRLSNHESKLHVSVRLLQ